MIMQVAFFLVSFVWYCQMDGISSSALAQVQQATADLEVLLAKPVNSNKADNDEISFRMGQLLDVIKTLGDARLSFKYQGLVNAKKQAIDLAEKNVVLQEKNSALQDVVDQTMVHVATQEKQIAKASKKLESVGLSLPPVKTTVSDLINQMDAFIDDFIKNATLSNLDSFEQSLDQMVQKALKKSTVQEEKNQISAFHNNARSIIYKKSFAWFCEGFDEITGSCKEMLDLLEMLSLFASSKQEAFINAVLGDDLLMFSIVFQDGLELILKMYDNFKKSCLQNGFAKKVFALLDDASKERFDIIFVEFIDQYNKIVDYLMNIFEMINVHLDDIAKTKPSLAQEFWQEIMSFKEAGYQYTAALDLFENEIMNFFADHQEYKKLFSDQAKSIDLVDIWDALSDKKFLIQDTQQSSSSIPLPPPLPPLFVSAQEQKGDADFNTQLAAAVKKQKDSSHNVVIPSSSKKPVAAKTAFLNEIESKAQERAHKSKDGTDPSVLAMQLNVRLKTFEKLEKRINVLGKFEKTALQEINSLKQQFDTLLYDKVGAVYSPRDSIAQYFEDLPEIDKIELKLDKKMIDSKKAGMSLSWTDDQKKRFEDKKKTLQLLLEQKKKTVFEYGINLSLESVKATQNMLSTLTSKLETLKNANNTKESGIISFVECERDLTYFYFLVRFGIYEPISKLPLDKKSMNFLIEWFNNTVGPLAQCIDVLSGITLTFSDTLVPDNTFGQRVVAPLVAIIEIMDLFESWFQLQKTVQAGQLHDLKVVFDNMNESLYSKNIIEVRDFQGNMSNFDNYIIGLAHKAKKKDGQ